MLNTKIKPDFDSTENDPTPTRRRFLRWGIYAVGAGVTGAIAIPVIGTFTAPAYNGQKLGVARAVVGKVEQLTNQLEFIAVPLEDIRYTDSFKPATITRQVFVRALNPNATKVEDFLVLDSTCTHLGCAVLYQPDAKNFKCPCHYSVFDENGKRIAGPAVRPLGHYKMTIENDELIVNAFEVFPV